MTKTICISDSYPLHPRLKKLGAYFNSGDIYYLLWNRSDYVESIGEYLVFNSDTGYGKKTHKMKDFPKFIYFAYQKIKELQPDTIICRHWQTFFFISLLNLKGVRVIYDVCDMPSNKIISFFEKRIIGKADQVVLSSRYFKNFYNHKNIVVLENRPELKNFININNQLKSATESKKSKLCVTFLGKIRYYEVMKNLINSIKNLNDIELKFYGDGPDYMALKNYSDENNIDNVFFYGRYSPEDISEIYSKTDIVWCAYPSDNFNVKYAISNKFFETLAFKKPGIFSGNTKISHEISENNIGFLVNPYSEENIKSLFIKISSDPILIEKVGENIKSYNKPIFWDEYLTCRGNL
ncbi:glycosyltransferase [Sutcliffiella horikoshii]|uniref:glycosyltransferase n=1 Tax=Sutcliffiella horikoshii TaxID=79883 RepID=UPI00384BDCE6